MHKQKLLVLLAGFALFAAACGGSSATVAEGDADTPTTDESASTQTLAAVSGDALPAFDPSDDTAIGLAAPNINITSLTAASISINQADGRGKVFGFFAHWCPHCQDELPVLVSYLDANGLPDNVDFHAVSTAVNAERDNYPPNDWFVAESWPFEVLADTQSSEIAQAFGLTGFPYFVIVGGDGTVVERIGGGLASDANIAAVFDTAAANAN